MGKLKFTSPGNINRIHRKILSWFFSSWDRVRLTAMRGTQTYVIVGIAYGSFFDMSIIIDPRRG
jgi:hypothetical protein